MELTVRKSALFAQRISELSLTQRSGFALSHAMCGLIDGHLREMWGEDGGGMTLLALGGYGRGEMAPFSDIDLMFLTHKNPLREDSDRVRDLVYHLWDDGFDVGYSIRSFRECIDVALSDNDTRTAVLESRFLAGASDIYRRFREEVIPRLMRTRIRKYIQEKLKEQEKRHRSFGETPYLLEPQIKEGEGGLRDIHTALWLMRVACRTDGFKGIDRYLDRREVIKLYAAWDFLQRIRIRLHLAGGRKNDTLDFASQDTVAADFGFSEKYGLSGAERLMRRYHLHAREAAQISKELVEHSVREAFGKIGGPSRFHNRKLAGGFSILRGYLVLKSSGRLETEPWTIMEAFRLSAMHAAPLSFGLKKGIKANLRIASGKLRKDPIAASAFLGTLKGPRVFRTLRQMHGMGVLGRYLPEFGRLKALVVREPYHRYTVDEHSLGAVKALEQLAEGATSAPGWLKNMFKGIGARHLLYLTVLIHDSGKGGMKPGGHSHVDLSGMLERLGLDVGERDMVTFLVHNHLFMSEVARKREIENPDVISDFARRVGGMNSLDQLTLVTYADISSVRPGFWTEWKEYLLRELHTRTSLVLQGDVSALREVPLALRLGRHADVESDEVRRHMDNFSARYLRAASDDLLIEDVRMLRDAAVRGFSVGFRDEQEAGGILITVCAKDDPGLLGGLAAIIAANGLNILKAEAFTGSHGWIIDRFFISNWHDVFWEGLESRLVADIGSFITSGKAREAPKGRPRAVVRVKSFITLDNESLGKESIFEVVCPDRLGLLAGILMAIRDAGLDVAWARVETDGEVASDTISVRKSSYDKIINALARLADVI